MNAFDILGSFDIDDATSVIAGLRKPANTREEQQVQDVAMLTVRAMINAAKADGHIDAAERQRIYEGFRRLGLEDRMVELVDTELGAPVDPAAVARGADSPEAAAEIYLASRLVIDPDHPSERRYLDDLAGYLKLDAGLLSELEAQARSA